MVNMDEVPVSSSEIRKDIKEGRLPQGLTESVLHYIRENELYED